MAPLYKFPRTPHVEGSRSQPGDEDLACVPFAALAGRHLVVEEKVDGSNTGISFDADGRLWLQSRGHFLTGGPRERQFELLKAWAATMQADLFRALGDRYVMYGEWLYAKHTVFYDALPHYFLEFDVLDTQHQRFLTTRQRRDLLQGVPVLPVPVLREGALTRPEELTLLLGHSAFKSTAWPLHLRERCRSLGLDAERVAQETDASDLMEGLYIKVEEECRVTARYKFVRGGFLTAVLDSGSHWLDRPIVPNQLRGGVDLFERAT